MTLQERLSLLRRRSGLTSVELAAIYCVTRMTIFNWSTPGRRKPRGLLGPRAEQVTTGLLTALQRGLLPLSKDLSKEQRSTRVKKMRDLLDPDNER